MKKLFYIVLIAAILALLPAESVFAAAYAVAGKKADSLLEYSDIEIYLPSEWAREQVREAERLGIAYPDRIEKYNRKLTRKELAYAAVNLYRLIGGDSIALTDADRSDISARFTDAYKNGKLFDDEVFLAIKYSLMLGTSETTFSPDGFVTREQTAAVLYRIVERFMDMSAAESDDLSRFPDSGEISLYAVPCLSVMVGEGIISGNTLGELAPKNVCTYEEVLAIAVRFVHSLERKLGIGLDAYYGAIIDAPQVVNVHTTQLDYQGKQTGILDAEWAPREGVIGYAVDCTRPDGTVLRTLTTNTGVTIFESDIYKEIRVYSIGQRGVAGLLGDYGASLFDPVDEELVDYTAVYTYNDYSALFNAQNEAENLINNYGSGFTASNPYGISRKKYSSNEEALWDMVEVTVPIWKMGPDNTRVAASASMYVYNAVAKDVVDIFTDIFNGPEQFPIYAIAGYNWRGAGSSSAHNQGLAIDINPDHNYFISTKGRILAGKMWEPSLSPYSIKSDGDVVRAFNKKGWFWGGIGWSSTGKDFMHFSYTGT